MSFYEKTGKLKAVTFSYDDNVTQDFQLVALLNKYGLKCTFNVNSQLIGHRGRLIRNDKPISWYRLWAQDALELYNGHEVAAHTLTHIKLPEASDEEVIRQVEQDRLNLSEMFGYEILGMAYPGGGVNYDDRVVELVKKHTGIKYARTIKRNDTFDLPADPYIIKPNVYHIMEYDRLMDLGRRFVELETDKPQMLYIWGHSYEMDYESDRWVKLEEFFKLISGREDIFYGTNREVLL